MTNFKKITEMPEALGAFLASLNVADSPWEKEFQKVFCADCGQEDCVACPHEKERNNPLWWLTLATARRLAVQELGTQKEGAAPTPGTRERQEKADRPIGYDAFVEKSIEQVSQAVMWVKKDVYREAMKEFAGKIEEARSERVKETGDKSFTYLEALLTELVERSVSARDRRAIVRRVRRRSTFPGYKKRARNWQRKTYTAVHRYRRPQSRKRRDGPSSIGFGARDKFLPLR